MFGGILSVIIADGGPELAVLNQPTQTLGEDGRIVTFSEKAHSAVFEEVAQAAYGSGDNG